MRPRLTPIAASPLLCQRPRPADAPRRRHAHLCRTFVVLTALILAGQGILAEPAPADGPATHDLFENLAFRHIGPVGNRVIAVTGVPGDANTYYVGAASGGIFKSTDGGVHWRPIFDDQPASSIGALAVAPSDPNVVWAGTGETFIRANISIGNGVYKSTDGGQSWQHMGLDKTGRIGRVIIHPDDPNTVYVAALGHCYGPQAERGIYRTQDGGATWKQVHFVSQQAGASDLVMDPNNPRILFAGMWEISVNTWHRQSGGPDSGLWVSRDGGDHWQKLSGHGLPKPPWGKIGLTMSAADSRRIYALIETSSNRDFAPSDPYQGVLWRSDDGGEKWTMVSADNHLVQRPLYYSRALASPSDASQVYFMSVNHRTSLDGGLTNFATKSQPGWDHHDMWIDPLNSQRMMVGHDGGVSISSNGGESWWRPQLPIAQMYHVAVDDQVPYFVYGNRQDGTTYRVPSNTLTGEKDIPIGAWQTVGGCEVGFTLPTPGDPDTIWSGCYDGILELYDHRTGLVRNVSVWPEAVESWPAIDLKYRFQWTFPMAISPHDPNRVYVGSQFLHQTTDRGQSWQVLSPDLTSNDPQLQQRSGGLTLDDAGPTLAPTLFAIAESPIEPGVLWTGSNDGLVQLSRDGGGQWQNVTANLDADLPPLGTVSNIEPSRHRPGTAYLTVDRHQMGDTATYAYKTEDYGQSWRLLRGDLPQDTFSYAHCLREDPKRPGLLYLGTENGVWLSFDDGVHWQRLRAGLPPAPVHWLTIPAHFDDLVVATYGRGFWILDDLSPLRFAAESVLDRAPVLLPPRPVYRFREREAPTSQAEDSVAGHNPEYGASLHYFLPAAVGDAATEEGEDLSTGDASLELRILDNDGNLVRKLDKLPREPGLHRVFWDLRYDLTREVELRTAPAENPHVPFGDKGWRPLIDGDRFALLAAPGEYQVELEVGDQVQRHPLEVRIDPQSAGLTTELQQQMEALHILRALIHRAAEMINEVEWTRQRIGELTARPLTDQGAPDEVVVAMADLDDALQAFEGVFFDLRLGEAGQESLRWKRLLYSKLGYLAWGIGRSDRRPTDAQLEVLKLYQARMTEQEERFQALQQQAASLDALLASHGVALISLGSGDGVTATNDGEAEPGTVE